ncbi:MULTISPECIES: DUF418 domain-containing protein [Actinoalloteichus]|uniref:DUF418 domain-containing protein n=2 Tax=Pseudonocardiaceae TaxID=2070 RepID=UPI0004C07CBA|nr:DUF418 domain-containing protein [Actinoalloteichus caeruleus]
MSVPATSGRSSGSPPSANTPHARSLAPDLARGVMLAVIALVHAHMLVGGDSHFAGGYPTHGDVLDRIAAAVLTLFADSRGYPMFAALFGYGLARVAANRAVSGWDWPRVRRFLRRRGWWMVLFGLFHAVLLFPGDILATYGLLALVFVGALRWSDRALIRLAGVCLVVCSTLYSVAFVGAMAATGSGAAAMETVDPLTDAAIRLASWPVSTLLFAVTSLSPFLVGIWAARRQLLEHPERSLGLLRATAIGGITIAVVGGLPLALIHSLLWTDTSTLVSTAAFALHSTAGVAGGLGYAALIALLAVRLGDRGGPLVTALRASGERSMTCYLLQSVVWFALFNPTTFNLGQHIDVATSVLVGLGVWVLGLLVADLLRRAGRRGPFEVLLRRLSAERDRGRVSRDQG